MTCHVKIRWFAYRRNYLTFHKGSSPLIQRFSPRTLVHPIFFELPEEKKPPLLSLRIFSNILQSYSKSWPRERLINVANGQMEFWTIKDGVRRRGWKGWFLSLSHSLWWAQVRQSKSWRRHRVRIVEQKESFACRARIYCLAGMSSVSGTDVDEWIKRKHEVWIIGSGRVRKIQKQSCKVCDGFKKG